MHRDLKWMLMGIFLAVVGVWCALMGGILAGLSVFVIILAVGFFAGGYAYTHQCNTEPPEYPMENNEKEQEQ